MRGGRRFNEGRLRVASRAFGRGEGRAGRFQLFATRGVRHVPSRRPGLGVARRHHRAARRLGGRACVSRHDALDGVGGAYRARLRVREGGVHVGEVASELRGDVALARHLGSRGVGVVARGAGLRAASLELAEIGGVFVADQTDVVLRAMYLAEERVVVGDPIRLLGGVRAGGGLRVAKRASRAGRGVVRLQTRSLHAILELRGSRFGAFRREDGSARWRADDRGVRRGWEHVARTSEASRTTGDEWTDAPPRERRTPRD